MKNYLKLIPAALALVALASCSSDDLFEKAANSNAVDGKTMEASIEDFTTTTRAAFAENKTDGKADKRALVWTAGDSYKVYGELATPDKYTLQNASAGKASGTFDLMTEDYNENPMFAVFPYDNIDADRANNKLTVTLSDWTYATAEVKDEGYSEGGFVSNVPMFGKIGSDPKQAAFGYMTAILRVDLSKLPKRSTRLILVTDRPLKGTFETEFDANGAYPEIVSPVAKASDKDNTTDVDQDGTPENACIMAISMNPVAQRTNKTFFIAVPTGNKYAKFDIYVEYNMGGSTQVELVGELGNTARQLAGKSVLNWQRGKVKSLTKEITVTANGNTPQAISQFLKEEWKTFPADAEINITVPDDGTGNYIDLNGAATTRIFTIPAELKNRVVNIIVPDDPAIIDGYSKATTMYIVDEDRAPVASTSLREINFCIPTSTNIPTLEILAPESQISLTAPEGKTATYAQIGKTRDVMVSIGDMDNEKAGLYVGEDVTITGLTTVDDGSFISEGTLAGGITNNGNYEILIKGDAGDITSTKDGKVTVIGALDANGEIDKNIGAIKAEGAGDVYVEKVKNVNVNKTSGDGAKFTGAVTVNDVWAIGTIWMQNAEHNKAITIDKVTKELGIVLTTGLGAIDVDDVVIGTAATNYITATNEENTSDYTVTNLKVAEDKTSTQTIAELKYQGKGNVTISGVKNNKDQYPTVTKVHVQDGAAAANIGTGAVSVTDVIIGTSLKKDGEGTLDITGVRAAFGDIINAAGNVTITGNNVKNANIKSLTQTGAGAITLKSISKSLDKNGDPDSPGALKTLTLNDDTSNPTISIKLEDAFVDNYVNKRAAKDRSKVAVNGIKSSGINDAITGATGVSTYTTDVWDGSSYATKASNQIYTSGSFAAMSKASNPSGAVTMYVDVDLNNKAWGGIKPTVTTLSAKKVSKLNGSLFQNNTGALTVTGLTIETASAANGVLMAKNGNTVNASLTAKTLTLTGNYVSSSNTGVGGLIGTADNAVTLTATVDGVTMAKAVSNAGGLIGIVNNDASIKASVKNVTIGGTASTGQGNNAYLGGMIGLINAAGKVIAIQKSSIATASIKGHYYMGGFIGGIKAASKVYLVGNGTLNTDATKTFSGTDPNGCTAEAITFIPYSVDGVWSTLKSGTIAPFIGGIENLGAAAGDKLQIYGEYKDYASFDRTANYWNWNFLGDETIKFKGTTRPDINFIGYTNADAYDFKYELKLISGFEAQPKMNRRSTTATNAILDTDYNVYDTY